MPFWKSCFDQNKSDLAQEKESRVNLVPWGKFPEDSQLSKCLFSSSNNLLNSSLWGFVIVNVILSVAWQEVSALAQQFIGGLLSFCVSQISLCTRENEKRGGVSAGVTHCRTGEESQSGGRLYCANAHSPKNCLASFCEMKNQSSKCKCVSWINKNIPWIKVWENGSRLLHLRAVDCIPPQQQDLALLLAGLWPHEELQSAFEEAL